MIKTENLSFSYGDNCILKNINASFQKGKIYSIIGTNGSGKTTLLNLLGRLSNPQNGSLFLDEKDFTEYTGKEFAKKIAVLPQSRNVPAISVYELVSHGRFPYLGFSRTLSENDKEQIKKALKMTQMTDFKDKNLTKLSGGERQRAYISMLLAQDTDYVLLDEPTTYLDISHSFEIINILKTMKESGKCVIVVLHDIAAALKFSDKILILNNNTIEAFDTPKEIIKSRTIDKVFGVECIEKEIDNTLEFLIRAKL